MNLEAEALNLILNDPSGGTLQKVLGTGFRFSSQNALVFDFVLDFQTKYKKLPEIRTISDHFPHFLAYPATESAEYILFRMTEQVAQTQISDIMEQVSRSIASGNTAAAISTLALAPARFSHVGATSSDLAVLGDAGMAEGFSAYRSRRDSGVVRGIPLGFTHIDDSIGGLLPGDFCVIAARPRSFKTWTLIQSAIAMARAGHEVLLFSKEMGKQQVLLRMYSLIARKFTHDQVRLYQLSDSDLAFLSSALSDLAAAGGKIHIIGKDAGAKYDLGFINQKIIEYKPAAALIDGAYLLGKTREWQDQAMVSLGLKDTAMVHEIPLLATTQFAKTKTAKSRLNLDDLAGSDAFAQDASIVIGQERIFNSVEKKLSNKLRIVTLKVREGEGDETFYVNAQFKPYVSFQEAGKDMGQDDEAEWVADYNDEDGA